MSPTGPLVLVVEDEPQMRRLLRHTLLAHGFEVVEAATAREALAHAASRNPDLVLLDLGLPDMDGLEVTRALRRNRRTPIIVVSARGQERDKVTALDLGADDYLTKPFGTGELLARMRAALRHAGPGPEAPLVYEAGDVRVDLARRLVERAGAPVHLTRTEYRLLEALVRSAGRVVTHRQLLEAVWGPNYTEQTHYLRVYMGQLRQKLEADPARPRLLRTEPGVGYRLHDAPS